MRRGLRIRVWFLLLVAELGNLRLGQSLRDLESFAIRHHSMLIVAISAMIKKGL